MNAGARPGALPSGLATFLFTDIEGSTRRWEADPEVMRPALADHDDVVRTAIEAHGGRVFKHTGDGVCGVHLTPSRRRGCRRRPAGTGITGADGDPTGEAELRGSDNFGAVLNRADRVMAAGHGGQFLLDGQTAGLLGGVDLVSRFVLYRACRSIRRRCRLGATCRAVLLPRQIQLFDIDQLHVRGEGVDAARGGAFRRIHRHVGLFEQSVSGDAGILGCCNGEPDAGPYQQLLAVDGERFVEDVDHPVGDHRRGIGSALDQDRELVAAEAADRVAGPQTPEDPFCDPDQQRVPCLMTEAVVDEFEVVQV